MRTTTPGAQQAPRHRRGAGRGLGAAPPRARRALARGALLLLGLGLAVALGEMLAAGLAARRCGGSRTPLWRPDRAVGWALVPGARAEVAVCHGTREIARRAIAVNARGYRDRPRRRARTPGVGRVLVLGDSFVEAMQVDLEETFAARLERRLGVEMLNAGVSGWSTDNQLRAFVAAGRRWAPDAVLLVFHVGNDVLENGPRLYLMNPHGLPPKPWLRPRGATGRLAACAAVHRAAARAAAATPAALWRHSRLVRRAQVDGAHRLVRAVCGDAPGPAVVPGVPELRGVYGPPSTPAWEEAWAVTERLLRRLDRRVRAAGGRLGVAVAPAGLEHDPVMRWDERHFTALRAREWDFAYPHRRLADVLARAGIPALSLVPALHAHRERTGRSGYHAFDGHWDAEGHAVVADALAGFVAALLAGAEADDVRSAPGP